MFIPLAVQRYVRGLSHNRESAMISISKAVVASIIVLTYIVHACLRCGKSRPSKNCTITFNRHFFLISGPGSVQAFQAQDLEPVTLTEVALSLAESPINIPVLQKFFVSRQGHWCRISKCL